MNHFKSCTLFVAFLFCFFFLFSYQNVFAQTDINGDIISTDTIWTKVAGPYVIYQSPTVEAGATLTIEPGTVVKFDFLEGIDVSGKLIADGTVNEKIYFTSLYDDSIGGDIDGDGGLIAPNSGDWQSINVLSNGSFEIKNSEINYAFVAIDSEDGSGILDSVYISHSFNGIYSFESTFLTNNINIEDISNNALYLESSTTATVTNSTIKNVGNYGVSLGYNSNLTFENSNIENIIGQDTEALDIRNDSYIKISSSTINNVFTGADIYENSKMDFIGSTMKNLVNDSNSSAFLVYNNSEINISSSTIDNVYGDYGIPIFNNGKVTISDSKISNFHGYSTFDLYNSNNTYATSSLEITNSEVTDGDTGFFVWGGAILNMTNTKISNFWEDGIYTFANSSITINYSEISSNGYGIENYGSSIEIKNSTIKDNSTFGILNDDPLYSPEITAINNWWGNDSGPFNAILNASGTSNTVSNNVNFIPWLTSDPKIQKKIPVIIIPGIMGTYLNKNYGDNSEIWLNMGELLTSFSDDFLNDLSLFPDGSENPDFPIAVGDIIRKVILAGNTVSNTWGGMIDTLIAGGYIEGVDLFVFPYDWRKSNADDAILLKDKIDAVLLQTGASKVDILAHSMGGLVAQKYIADNGANKIDKLFFIGTPHLGAPKAFKALMYGDDMGINMVLGNVHLLNQSEVKIFSQNLPAVFDLLPSQSYTGLEKYIYDATASTSKWLDYDETKSFMINHGRNSTMFPQAESLHADIDNFNLSGTDVYNFAGCGLTKTIGSITVKKKKSWTSLFQEIVDDYSLEYTNGDETVPLISSVGPFGNHNYFVKGASHSELPSASNVPDIILSILSASSTQTVLNISTSSSFCDVTGRVVSTHSPVVMNIYDSAGNHTGPTITGDIEYGIPGVSYDTIEGDAFAFLPQIGIYRIVIKATDTGAYDFYLSEIGNNDVKTGESYWNEIPLASLLANFEINISATSTIYKIKTDEDGDGIFESNFLPAATLLSSSAGDLISPQTSSSVSADGIVSFSATDNNAGVLKTEYSFDGNTWILYNGPFSASGKTVYYFSTDNAGNIESIKNVSIPGIPSIVAETNGGGFSSENPNFLMFSSTSIAESKTKVVAPLSFLLPTNNKLLKKETSGRIPTTSVVTSLLNTGLTASVADAEANVKPIVIVVSVLSLGVLVFIIKKYMIKI